MVSNGYRTVSVPFSAFTAILMQPSKASFVTQPFVWVGVLFGSSQSIVSPYASWLWFPLWCLTDGSPCWKSPVCELMSAQEFQLEDPSLGYRKLHEKLKAEESKKFDSKRLKVGLPVVVMVPVVK